MSRRSDSRPEDATARYGLSPERDIFRTKTVTLDKGDPAMKTEDIRQYFHKTFEVYEALFQCVASDEAYTVKPIHGLRHPLIFYLGHTATFYINKLVLAGLTTRINPQLEEMFAVGVDEMSWDDLNDAHYSWPEVSAVYEYRRIVRERIDSIFKERKHKLTLPVTFNNSTVDDDHAFFWTIMMGCEHERIHLETASVHVRELPLKYVKKVDVWRRHCPELKGNAPINELVPFEGGQVSLGRPEAHPAYGWDTDYGVQRVNVAPFAASKYLVSNADFLEFMQDGGYATKRHWDAEGWSWVTWKKPTHPWFWVPITSTEYSLRLLVEEVPLPMDWPVEVNHLEAKAYCNWLSEKKEKPLRLPTEAEWMHLRDTCVREDQFQWKATPGNINLEAYTSSCPVNRFKQGPLYDVVGNVWQHCETPNYPYKGYRVHPFYDDFSMPTFDGRHMTMKGGSWISTGNEATRDARFAFRRHFFQYIGIRFIDGPPVDETKYLSDVLGMDPEVDQAADFAFGEPTIPGGKNFGAELAALAWQQFCRFRGKEVQAHRAMELLCGAARTSFSLTQHFMEVTGVDFSARQLQVAFALRERGSAQYSVVNAFGKREARTIQTSDYPFHASRERAFFYQADPCNLHGHLSGFDLIVAWRVLERSYNPRLVPPHLVSRLNVGGILLLISDYAWCEKVAPADHWLQPTGGAAGTPREQLLRLLGDTVEEVDSPKQIVACMPTTERSGTLSVMEVLTLRKRM